MKGYGTQIQVEISSTYTKIAAVVDATPPQRTRDDIESTSFDTPDEYKDYEPGLKEPGEFSFNVIYDPDAATHEHLADLFESGDTANFRIVLPSGKRKTFPGYCKGIGTQQITPNALVTQQLTIKVKGKVVLSDPA